jgi:hypothetical protein
MRFDSRTRLEHKTPESNKSDERNPEIPHHQYAEVDALLHNLVTTKRLAA